MSMTWTTYLTAEDGSSATISGDIEAVTAIERALEKAGARYNESVGTWDFGFYRDTPRTKIMQDSPGGASVRAAAQPLS